MRTSRLARLGRDPAAGLTVAAAALAVLAVGCSASAQGGSGSSGSASPAQTAPVGPTPIDSQSPNPSVRVYWGNGRDVPGMKEGVPNPPGWYDFAFGGQTSQKIIYLTFDDGPWMPYTREILALLARHRSKATFFVTGAQSETYPELIRSISAAGHAIGDHTQNHADLVALSPELARRELADVQRAVGPAMGGCMRPPYGLIDTRVADVAQSLGLVPILWTGQAADWEKPPAGRMVEALRGATRPGAVLLLHDGGGDRANTVAAVAEILPWWRAEGYELATVPACRTGPAGS